MRSGPRHRGTATASRFGLGHDRATCTRRNAARRGSRHTFSRAHGALSVKADECHPSDVRSVKECRARFVFLHEVVPGAAGPQARHPGGEASRPAATVESDRAQGGARKARGRGGPHLAARFRGHGRCRRRAGGARGPPPDFPRGWPAVDADRGAEAIHPAKSHASGVEALYALQASRAATQGHRGTRKFALWIRLGAQNPLRGNRTDLTKGLRAALAWDACWVPMRFQSQSRHRHIVEFGRSTFV